MTTVKYPEVWDLDVFFKGGSESEEFKSFIDSIPAKIDSLQETINSLEVPTSALDASKIAEVLEQIKDVMAHVSHAGGVLSCLTAQDTTDREALLIQGKLGAISATISPVIQKFHKLLTDADAEVFESLLATEELAPFAFIMTEWREQSRLKLSQEEEALISALGVDGYHSWGQLYNMLIGDIKVQVEVDGEVKTLSVGQANNLSSNKDPKVRKDAFDALEKVFTEKEEFFAKTLNHLGGFRLATYKARGWENVLQEPLTINRMKQETLDAMWGAITDNKAPFAKFLTHKANMIGKEQMHWYDFDAPVTASTATVPYQEGAEFILKQFGKFGKELEAFTLKAFEDGWIEAEDRDNKRPGGFCTGMPLAEQ